MIVSSVELVVEVPVSDCGLVRVSATREKCYVLGMQYSAITQRLTAKGLGLVDATRGLEDDLKWRHPSVTAAGSLWVKDDSVHATGWYAQQFGPGGKCPHCRYPVWVGTSAIDGLLRKIEKHFP